MTRPYIAERTLAALLNDYEAVGEDRPDLFRAIAASQHRRHSGFAPSPSVSAIRRVSTIAARHAGVCVMLLVAVFLGFALAVQL